MATHCHEQFGVPTAHAMDLEKTVSPPLSTNTLAPVWWGRGVSTHATQTCFDDIDNGTSWESIFTFDMYHAFDSPPKILIRDVLQCIGSPTKLLLFISTVLEHGSTYIRGTPDETFSTTHSVKQGYPISFFLFVIAFEIPLRYIHSYNILFSAYVNDISTPVAHTDGPRVTSIVKTGLDLIGCQLNVRKMSPSLFLHTVLPPPCSPSIHIRPLPCRSPLISGSQRAVQRGVTGLTPPSTPWPRYLTSCTWIIPSQNISMSAMLSN